MICPVCKEEMIILEYDEIEIDYCVSCQGVWLDQGELEVMLDFGSGGKQFAAPSGAQKGKRKCPRCHKKMFAGLLPGTQVSVDYCPLREGIWFDKGELVEICKAASSSEVTSRVQNFFESLFFEDTA